MIKDLKLLLTNTGPGSYTALRVGISFLSGLSVSKNIKLKGIPCCDLISYVIPREKLNSSGIYINSSNNQNFICFFSNNNTLSDHLPDEHDLKMSTSMGISNAQFIVGKLYCAPALIPVGQREVIAFSLV